MKLRDYIEKLQILADNGHADREVYLTQGVENTMTDRWLDASKKAAGPVLYGYRKFVDKNGNGFFLDERWMATPGYMSTEVFRGMQDLETEGKLPPMELFIGIE